MNIDNGLAQRLKELRKKAGLTQEELAELIDVHLNTISRWENGIDTPKTFKITQLAKVLNVNEVELINGTPSQNWELKLLVSKTRENEGGRVDMSGKSSTATLSVGDDANSSAFGEVINAMRSVENALKSISTGNNYDIDINQQGFMIEKKSDADMLARSTVSALRAGIGNGGI